MIWPGLVVAKGLIHEARNAEMRENAKRRDVSKVPMSPAARQLFDALRERVLKLDSGSIELAEQRSVSYHGSGFFLEFLPRKNRIGLVPPLDLNEIDDPSGIAEDTAQFKFLVNAVYEGGAYVRVQSETDIENALPMIRLAREVQ